MDLGELEIVFELLSALAIGLLIGIERGWSGRQEEEGDRVAGIRTFSLVGLLGGVWAQMADIMDTWIIGLIFLAVVAMIIVSYLVETRENEDIGTTTAFAMMLTFTLGAWAAFGYYIYALGVTAIVVMLLGLKPVLHRWVGNIETKEIYAGIKLLIITAVLLPLLPDQGYGPWDAINPRWMWYMVVLISGLSFLGYFSMKHVGSRMGTLVTSIAGGLASSTAVTLSMAQFAVQHSMKSIFMAGVLIASSIMFIRVLVEVAIVNPALLHPLWIPVLVMFVSIIIGGFWLWKKRSESEAGPAIEISNPFKLTMALKFGLLLGVVLLLAAAMQEWFGDQGIYALSFVSGLADVDAITLSLSRMAMDQLSEDVAVLGIIIASMTNTLVKGVMFAVFVGLKDSLKLLFLMLLSVILGLITVLIVTM